MVEKPEIPQPLQKLGEAIRSRRGSESVGSLAARCKISYKTIYLIEKSQLIHAPRAITIQKLAKALGADEKEWLGWFGMEIEPSVSDRAIRDAVAAARHAVNEITKSNSAAVPHLMQLVNLSTIVAQKKDLELLADIEARVAALIDGISKDHSLRICQLVIKDATAISTESSK